LFKLKKIFKELDKMKLGILGTGMIVQDFLTVIEKLKIDYLAILGTERSRERTEELAEKYKLDKIYFDYDELLADENIDTVYVALPNFLHHQFAKKALLADKNVIVEKPCVTNLAEFNDLKNLVEQRGKILIEATTTHYLPAFNEMKKDLSQLGEIKIVSVNYSQYSSRYDKFKAGEILPAFDPQKAGGALMDINFYNINFVVGLFGKPESVFYSANIERNIDTSGILILDYGNFKAVCIGAKDCQAPTTSTIQGDKGNIIVNIPANRIESYTLCDNGGNEELKIFTPNSHRMIFEFEKFIEMIDNHDVAKMNEMLNISETVAKIIQQARDQVGIVFPND